MANINYNKMIIHCDMNNFFASVECLYDQSIREKPVIVCGNVQSRQGIVLAKNDIAKKMGILTGESVATARNKCATLIEKKPDYSKYLKIAKSVREIFSDYSDIIEPYGLDEAWVDVTEIADDFSTGEKIADEIRNRIKTEIGITASIGVSFNKIFAKLGSDMKKPDATTVISKENYKRVVWIQPASNMLFVGASTRHKLFCKNILTIGDIANADPILLKNLLGQNGLVLWSFANGDDSCFELQKNEESAIKSIGNNTTLAHDLINNADVHKILLVLCESVSSRLRRHDFRCRSVQITIKDNNFKIIQRQKTLTEPTNITDVILENAFETFKQCYKWERNVRSIGVRVSSLEQCDDGQLMLFENTNEKEKIEKAVDEIRKQFGYFSMSRASLLKGTTKNQFDIRSDYSSSSAMLFKL